MELAVWKPLAGLALFLLALAIIEKAVQALSGARFRSLLADNTDPPAQGVVSGAVATAVLQSSSLVGLIMLAFVGAGVIRLKNALAVVIGANLGTTATGWVVATIGFKLDLEALAFPLIAIGGLAATAFGAGRYRRIGRLVLGLGLLLFGLELLKSTVDDSALLLDPEVLSSFSAIEYLLFGAVASALIQSSSATMAVTLSALSGGLIDLHDAAAIVIGADLGTTSTVVLGALGGTPNKKRIAMGHVLFNLGTDIVAFVLLAPLLAMLLWLDDPLLTLVAFHTTFNLLGIAMFLPVIGPFAGLLESRLEQKTDRITRFLETSIESIPDAAIGNLEKEVGHLIRRVIGQNALALGFADDSALVAADVESKGFAKAYDETKLLEGAILEFSYGLDRSGLSWQHSRRIEELLQAARDGVLASKACRDSLADLEAARHVESDVCARILDGQEQFYERVAELAGRDVIPVSSVEHLVLAVALEHRRVHELISRDIADGKASGQTVSQLLNLNRLLYTSQQHLLTAISQWVGIDVLKETVVKAA